MRAVRFTNFLPLICLSALLCLPAPHANGDDIDPKVVEVVNAWSTHLKELDAFQQAFRVTTKIEAEGMKNEMTATYKMAMAKPNRFALVLEHGINGITAVSDGKTLFGYMPMSKVYTKEDAPETLEALAENQVMAMIGMGMGGFGPAQIFLAQDPAKNLLEGVAKAEYAGEKERGGVATHHLKFYQEEFDWEAWFSVGEPSVLVDLKPDFTKAFEAYREAMPGEMQDMKMETTMTFSDWREGDIDASLFSFTPPEGATLGASLFEGMDVGDPEEESAESALVDTEAPLFKLDLLDGGEVDLAAHKGEDVVVLDFWATWCPPCVRGLPKVAGICAEFKDRGVAFYAVNQREKPAMIKKFLEKKGLNMAVALDSKGKVATQYKVTGIPQTVVIDRAGKVVDVHVGFSPGMEKTLREKLEELTDGEE